MAESRQFNHDDYTVGWICALPNTEMVAATAMLDKEHPVLPAADPKDTNTYVLGEIDDHNVVVACLPAGSTGKVSAATVAVDMLRSFPAVRFGLMVGVGGGAPYYPEQQAKGDDSEAEDDEETRDIRLGDVAVSVNTKTSQAVIQYDFGKSLQSGGFVHMGGSLNKPPAIVMTGVSTLQSKHTRDGNKIRELLDGVLAQYPNIAEEFNLPAKAKDRLFKSNIDHVDKKKSCKACCGPEDINLVKRTHRKDTNPRVHYGVIGSADNVMKNAVLRDKWAREKGIICFEMEAAGLMDAFPCLVIRGICDYADSHKNKVWQPYAAATAACYAKKLLQVIPGQGVEKLEKLKQLTGMLAENSAKVENISSKMDEKEDREIIDWITKVNFVRQQRDYLSMRHPGTGEWFLNSTKFQEWRKEGGSTLFCTGAIGAGKTVITSLAIDNLLQMAENGESIGIAYIYFDFELPDEQRVGNLLSSLLRQLAERRSPLPEEVKNLFNKHKSDRTLASFEEICATLHAVAIKFSRVFIFIDALDEGPSLESGDLQTLLHEILLLQASCRANLFVTSRENTEIEELFPTIEPFPIHAPDHDISTYLQWQMEHQDRDIWDEDLKDDVKRKIIEAAGGIFYLAVLYIKRLMTLPTKVDIDHGLEYLNIGFDGLDDMYNDTMERIEAQSPVRGQIALQTLSWIFYAKRPLSISELQNALAIKRYTRVLDANYVLKLSLLGSITFGLITIDEESQIVGLVHETAQRYLLHNRYHQLPYTEVDITLACMTYLSFETFMRSRCPSKQELDERIRLNPLYHYAITNWGRHAFKAFLEEQESGHYPPGHRNRCSHGPGSGSHRELTRKVVDFLNSEAVFSASHQALAPNGLAIESDDEKYRGLLVPHNMFGMHLAAYFCLDEIVNNLLEIGHPLNPKDFWGNTPLSWAAKEGYLSVVQVLLEHGAATELGDEFDRTPLLLAAYNGHLEVVEALIEHGASLDSTDDQGKTALLWASYWGHTVIVEALVKTKAVIDTADTEGQTPLSLAAGNGDVTIVEILLQKGASPNSKSHSSPSSFCEAVSRGHEMIALILLLKGATVDFEKNEYDRRLLLGASLDGNAAIVDILLDLGSPIDQRDDETGNTALITAAREGHESVAKILLERGAAIDVTSLEGETALFPAAQCGYDSLVKLLLDGGAAVNIKDSKGRTPLSWAAGNGHLSVVKTLLGRGAAINLEDVKGRTPLDWARKEEHQPVVQALFLDGARSNFYFNSLFQSRLTRKAKRRSF